MARPLRLSTFSYIGPAKYFLTFCTRQRRQAFSDATAVGLVLAQLRRTASEEGFVILAYCLMPDHGHFLVEALGQESDFRRFSKMARQRSGGAYQRRFGTALWQPGYFERVLRDGDDAKQIAGYILNNPVRAGLVKSPADYPYLGSDVWTLSDLLETFV